MQAKRTVPVPALSVAGATLSLYTICDWARAATMASHISGDLWVLPMLRSSQSP